VDKWLARVANVSLVVIAAVFLLKVAVAHFGRVQTGIPLPKERLSFDGAATIGSSGAEVGVIEFSDFQCPFCAQVARETLPMLIADYAKTGKVRFGFRHMPLSVIHHFSMRAAAGATCAGQQGQFWKMHDVLFANQATLSDEHIRQLGQAMGLDMERFEACWDTEGRARASADGALAVRLHVQSTPSFFVGKIGRDGMVTVQKTISGVPPMDVLKAALDKLMSSS
jgi:protein-disulfide isomerase